MTQVIHDTLNTLVTSFAEFKNRQDERLSQLDTLVEKAAQRIEKMELSSQRPLFSSKTSCQKSAGFSHFVRKGIEDFSHKSLSSHTEAGGGYLVPHPIVQMIHQSISSFSVIRQLAANTIINSDSLELLLEKKEAEAGWVTEIATRDETSTPELAKIRIPVHQIYAKPRVSQKLLDDSSINIDQWICDKIADKFAKIENSGFLFGDGKGKPRGLLTAETCDLTQEEWGKVCLLKTAMKDNFADPNELLQVIYSLKSQYLPGAVWIMPRAVAFKIAQLKNKEGQYIWQQSLVAAQPSTLLGHCVYLCDDMVKEDTPHRIIFGNIKEAYHIVDRAQISIMRDPFSAKPYVEFYATKRVGGEIVNCDAMKYIELSKD